MPFCIKCGADVTSKTFCVQCGTAVGARPFAPPPAPAASAPAGGKVSPIVWILGGIAAVIVVIGAVLTAGGLFLAHKVTQNPALATAKILTAANPDIEVLSADEGKNTVTFKDKKTGETVTMNFDDIKKGKIVFKGSNGQQATINAQGDGQKGTLEINSPEGSVKFGAGSGAKIPGWVPAYPGVDPQTTFSVQSNDADGGTFQFTTKDAAKDVLSFYEKGLKDAGFKITANFTGNTSDSSGGMLSAEETGAKHTVMVTVGTDKTDTTVNVVFGTNKK